MYGKDDIKSDIIDVPDSIDASSFESLYIQLQEYKTCIGIIYRPPDTNLDIFNEQYCKLLSHITRHKQKFILVGDFNINLLSTQNCSKSNDFLENSFCHFMYPTITRPTRIASTSATLIDNIFTSNITKDYLAGIIISDISDHLPIFYIENEPLEVNKIKVTSQKITYRDINDTNTAKFIERIRATKWERIISETRDVNEN